MPDTPIPLLKIFDGWQGYNTSIIHSIQPLTREQLIWRSAPNLRSVGELAGHIAFGRVGWFSRLKAPGSLDLFQKAMAIGDENVIADRKDEILNWLELSWQMVANALSQWTVDDLWLTFEQEFRGVNYQVPYQWVIWRIISHDMHHGGELSLALGMQGIKSVELGDLGGHITMPPVVDKP